MPVNCESCSHSSDSVVNNVTIRATISRRKRFRAKRNKTGSCSNYCLLIQGLFQPGFVLPYKHHFHAKFAMPLLVPSRGDNPNQTTSISLLIKDHQFTASYCQCTRNYIYRYLHIWLVLENITCFAYTLVRFLGK